MLFKLIPSNSRRNHWMKTVCLILPFTLVKQVGNFGNEFVT